MSDRSVKANIFDVNVDAVITFMENYKIVDHDSIIKKLHIAINNRSIGIHDNKQVAIIVTGPIAVGKSTLIYNMFDYFDFDGIEYIGTDIYYLKCKRFLSINTFKERYNKCKYYAYDRIRNAIAEGCPFIWETVISKKEKFEMIKEIKDSGYYIIGLFLGNDSVNINIQRAIERAKYYNPWNVKKEKIESRYKVCMNELINFCKLVDTAILVDTSESGELVMYKEEEKILYYDEYCKWISQYLPKM